jgi:nucleoside-diphosphate-sugar epimerase
MRVVVTGGKGLLGTEVVRSLEAHGATVTSASRRTGVDLATGAGLEAALEGAECVVHAAVHPLRHRAVNLDGTRQLINVMADRRAPPHVVYVSIVGCNRIPFRFTARSTPASWYWSAASCRSRWFGLRNSTPWSRQLLAL